MFLVFVCLCLLFLFVWSLHDRVAPRCQALEDNGPCVQLHDDDAPVFRIVHKINERTQKTQVVPQIKVNNSQAIAIAGNQVALAK